METKIFKKYKALILDDTFTESSITSFRALMNGFKRTNLTDDERETLNFLFENSTGTRNSNSPRSLVRGSLSSGSRWGGVGCHF